MTIASEAGQETGEIFLFFNTSEHLLRIGYTCGIH
jgi:hypothetical protein